MKNTVICAVAAGVLLLAGSCQEKEGTFVPVREIEKVYRSTSTVNESYNDATGEWDTVDYSSTPKTLVESWEWDEDLLEKIVLHGNEQAAGSEKTVFFTYNQDRISVVETTNERIEFTYSGSKLDKVDLYDKSVSTSTAYMSFSFRYDGGRISTIEVITSEAGKKGAVRPLQSRLMAMMQQTLAVPQRAVEQAAARADQRKASVSQVLKLKWIGNNVSSVETEDDYSRTKVEYTYDNQINPLRHFVFTICGIYGGEDIVFANQNNIVKAVTTYTLLDPEEPLEERSEEQYVYTYSGDWPMEKQQVKVYGSEDEGSRITMRTTLYYEYK